VGLALATASRIRWLGTAGASGLLALIYPDSFGTVDQFVVKALSEVGDPQVVRLLAGVNPDRLGIQAGTHLMA